MFPRLFEDLNKVAEGYLRVRTSDKIEYARILIRNQHNSILPLVIGLLDHFKRDKQGLRSPGIHLDEEMLLQLSKVNDEPIFSLVVDVTNHIEARGQDHLITLLDNPDKKIVKTSALILSRNNQLTSQSINKLDKIILKWDNDHKRINDKMLLCLALERNNIPKARQYLSKQAENFGKDLDDYLEILNSLALYELKYKD